MTKLSEKEVKRVAELAKLKLSGKEIEKFREQLGEVLQYMEQLKEIKVERVEPTAQTTGLLNVLGDDRVSTEERLSQKEALSGTDKTEKGYFKVPAVLEKE